MPEFLTDVFYDLTVKAKKPHHFIKLNSEVEEDMKVWLSFLESFNGKAYFPESEWSDNETLELYTDSAGSETMGGGGGGGRVLAFSQKSGCFFSGHRTGST